MMWVLCVYQVVNEMYGESFSIELDDLPLHSSQYHMTEFAKKYFREAQRNKRSVRSALIYAVVESCQKWSNLKFQLALI